MVVLSVYNKLYHIHVENTNVELQKYLWKSTRNKDANKM